MLTPGKSGWREMSVLKNHTQGNLEGYIEILKAILGLAGYQFH